MKKETVYKIIILILVGLNVLQLAPILLMHKPHQPQNERFEQLAVQKMKLTKEQQDKFLEFAHAHRERMMQLFDRQSDIVVAYFTQPADSLLEQLTQIEREKVEATQQHFNQIKNILNENQLPLFYEFKQQALRSILEGNGSQSPPR